MNRFKRAVCILLSVILLTQPVIPARAAQDKDARYIITQSYTNPIYQHLTKETVQKKAGYVSEAEIEEELAAAKLKAVAKSQYLTSDERVAAVIRKGMTARESEIEFHYKNKNAYTDQDFYDWMELAMMETDNPDEGDYIRWHFEHVGLSGSLSYNEADGMYYGDYLINVTYHTTKAQEAKVTERVEEVLDDIGANDSGVTNYEKTKLIYDYICENVSYDMENVDNDEYTLKYTAYAALINKKAVCQGYASLLYRMLEECGIDARIIYGTSQGEMHGWNISELGSTYYLLDSTWDAGEADYSYFLNGKNNFPNHTTESEFFPDYNVSSSDYDTNKPTGEIRFTQETAYTDYTGKAVAADRNIVEVVKGNKNYEFRYYTDKKCSKSVTAPVKAGIYYVKAVAAENTSYQYTESENVLKLIVRPARIDSLDAANKYNGIQLTWTKRGEADGYIIYKRTMDTEYEELARIENNSTLTYLDKDIKQGKKFLYNIVAYKNIDGGELKGLKRANARQIVRATVKTITNQNGSVKVTWTKVPDAAGYKIYRKAAGYDSYGMLSNIKNGSTTSYTDKYAKSIRNGKASYYYVVPYYSESSKVVLKTNTKTNYYMTRPTFSTLEISGSGALKAIWKKNAKATGYQIRYSLNSDMSDADTVNVSSGSTLNKKITGLKKNKTYYVQVRSFKTYNNINYCSAWSVKKSKKTKS